jgi:hypothetical protein
LFDEKLGKENSWKRKDENLQMNWFEKIGRKQLSFLDEDVTVFASEVGFVVDSFDDVDENACCDEISE